VVWDALPLSFWKLCGSNIHSGIKLHRIGIDDFYRPT
jgi:hypothetical protein